MDEPVSHPPSAELAVLAALLQELERESPGLVKRVRRRLEDEDNISRITRLRSASAEPAIRSAIANGAAWVRRISVVVERGK